MVVSGGAALPVKEDFKTRFNVDILEGYECQKVLR
jgi:hypothetical protein